MINSIFGEKMLWAAGAGAGQGGASGIIMLIVIFALFYFLLILPQQKQAKKHKEMINNLQKGDKIITSGGLIGTIVAVTEKDITVQLAENVKVKLIKSYVATKLEEENQVKK